MTPAKGSDPFAGFGDEGDELATILNTPAEQRTPAKQPPVSYKAQAFDEPCPKCRGTGHWRPGYPCFTCKGKGKQTFKQPAEKRAQQRATTHARKARVLTDLIDGFKAEQPDVWAWMDGNDFPFAVAMRDALHKYGSLTERQLAASQSIVVKRKAALEAAKQRKAEQYANATSADVSKMQYVFRQLEDSGLRKIKVYIRGYVFAPSWKYKDAVAVMKSGQFIGRIQDGKLLGFRCDEATEQEVATIASDPRTAALAHGLETGQCAICGAELTNPVSIKRGIGPICAGRVGW